MESWSRIKKYSEIIAAICLVLLVIIFAMAYSFGYIATISDDELIFIQEVE